ncbi:MAG TPA: metal ABC transporter permease [Verrucomicrobiae bacterium]|nr:metal ABC transporter permease [Verrucomicrobiae bacterium]
MFEALREILAPDFLLRNSIWVTLMVGIVCPIVGCYLILRRLVFLGVALPQVASAGVALTLSLHIWVGHDTVLHEVSESHLAGSLAFTFITIVALACIERWGRGAGEGGLGALYVLTTAASILILAKCPSAEQSWLSLFKGEIVAVGLRDVVTTAISFALALAFLIVFAKELLLVSYDREMAITLRKNVFAWDLSLYLTIGLVIAVAVLTVGPLVTFGFLIIPPLIVHPWAGRMRRFFIASSIVGAACSFIGFWIAYRFDLPVGPTDVALLGVLLGLSRSLRKLLRL